MTEKEVTMEELEETVKCAGEQLELLEWRAEDTDPCVTSLLRSVSEVRGEYQQLRRELVEVQALQREVAARLRAQLRHVHSRFNALRQRIADAHTQR